MAWTASEGPTNLLIWFPSWWDPHFLGACISVAWKVCISCSAWFWLGRCELVMLLQGYGHGDPRHSTNQSL